MTVRYHYDADGSYKGKSMTEMDVATQWLLGVAMAIAALYFGVRWLWETLEGYARLAFPYNYLVGWYRVLIVLPVDLANAASAVVGNASHWPNVNRLLRAAVFLAAYVLPYASALLLLRRVRSGAMIAAVAVLGPLVVMGLWALGSGVLGWLFAGPAGSK